MTEAGLMKIGQAIALCGLIAGAYFFDGFAAMLCGVGAVLVAVEFI